MRGLLSGYRSRKYLQQIILSTTLLIAFVLTLSSLSLYLYGERVVLGMQRDSNEKVLAQMNFNISNMNQIVQNFAFTVFFDYDFQPFMDNDDSDMFEYLRRVNKLKHMIAPNTFIHSIVFYNNKMDALYTISSQNVKALDRSALQSYLSGETAMRKLQFVPFKPDHAAQGSGWDSELFSMFIYDSMDTYDASKSFMMININPEWLFQNIDLANRLTADEGGSIYLLDQNQRILSADKQPVDSPDPLRDAVYRHMAQGRSEDQFTYLGEDGKQVVNYMANDANDWTIVSVQPYKVVLGPLNRLKTACIVIIAVCLLIAVVITMFISRKLYHPIERLMNQLKRFSGQETEEGRERDELQYMSRVYAQTMEKMRKAESNLDRSQTMIKSYYLRKLISDSASFTADELRECAEKGYFRIDPNGEVVLVVLMIDRFRKLAAMSARERGLVQFAVSNIAEDIVASAMPCDVLSIRGEHYVIAAEPKRQADGGAGRLIELIRRVQETVQNYYHLSLTAVFSEPVNECKDISRYYGRTMEDADYRLLFGAGSLITPNRVKRNRDNPDLHLPEEMEKKLAEAILLGHTELATDTLNAMKEKMAAMRYEAALQSLIRLGTVIQQSIQSLNQNKLAPITVQVNHSLFHKETVDEAFEEFAAILASVAAEQKQAVNQKNEVLTETVKDFIHNHYADPNLSLQGIAAMLKMSPAYVGRMFKKQCGQSVAEYINDIRMKEAVALLENNEMPVYEIVQEVGFANPNYFFKLFKQRFGTTPKEYRIRRSIE